MIYETIAIIELAGFFFFGETENERTRKSNIFKEEKTAQEISITRSASISTEIEIWREHCTRKIPNWEFYI